MADSNTQLHWTDEQWNKVRQVVYEEARKARVAGNFLPLYGPLDPDATYVTQESLVEPYNANDQGKRVAGFTVTDTRVLKLTTLQVKVYLKGAQVADPELTSALIAFRRAANIVARFEDEIIFVGQPDSGTRPSVMETIAGQVLRKQTQIGEVIGGERTDGLLASESGGLPTKSRHIVSVDPKKKTFASYGEALVSAISQAIADLEAKHHLGPFACVLGQQYFTEVQTPERSSMVLPQDRILPFLGGGTLVRTSTLPDDVGLVIALGGEPIDLVVGTDISVKFLQVTLDPWFVFRVYEKIVLRIKQPEAIAILSIPPTAITGAGPQAPGLQAPGPQAPGPQAPGPQAPGPQAPGPQAQGPQAQGPQAQGPQAQGPQAQGPQAQGPQAQGPQAQGNRRRRRQG
jgi:uncharacterized linocin/CFP29 family protein